MSSPQAAVLAIMARISRHKILSFDEAERLCTAIAKRKSGNPAITVKGICEGYWGMQFTNGDWMRELSYKYQSWEAEKRRSPYSYMAGASRTGVMQWAGFGWDTPDEIRENAQRAWWYPGPKRGMFSEIAECEHCKNFRRKSPSGVHGRYFAATCRAESYRQYRNLCVSCWNKYRAAHHKYVSALETRKILTEIKRELRNESRNRNDRAASAVCG